MKLGRACAAAAVLWAVALPFTAGTALADEAAVTTSPQAPPVATTPEAPRPAPEPSDVRDRAEPEAAPAEDRQVPLRPRGAPETGGGPEESGIDLAVAGGAASVVAVVAGGAVLVSRRRRAGAH